MSARTRQAAMARFLLDPEFEARCRRAPEETARELGVDARFARQLAAIDPDRVRSFRRSRHVKAARRGEPE